MVKYSTLKVAHLAIGTELTTGQTQNSNSTRLARLLSENGVKNGCHLIVPDQQSDILKALTFLADDHQWILIYGGLGPTSDDFTRYALAEWTQLEMVTDQDAWQNIQTILTSRNYPIHAFQARQSEFPKGSQIMTNTKGTAHGFHLSHQGKEFFVFPGPPKEVESVIENYFLNWLTQNKPNKNQWVTYMWNTMGLGESEVADRVESLAENFPVELGYRVHLPYVEFKISFDKKDESDVKELITNVTNKLRPFIVYGSKYPFHKVIREKISSFSLIEIHDMASNGLVADELKNLWDSNSSFLVTNKKTNLEPLANKWLLAIDSLSNLEIEIKEWAGLNHRSWTLDLSNIQKLPKERIHLFIKERVLQKISNWDFNEKELELKMDERVK